VSVDQLLWAVLTTCLLLHSCFSYRLQTTQKRTLMTPDPADEGDIQVEYSSH